MTIFYFICQYSHKQLIQPHERYRSTKDSTPEVEMIDRRTTTSGPVPKVVRHNEQKSKRRVTLRFCRTLQSRSVMCSHQTRSFLFVKRVLQGTRLLRTVFYVTTSSVAILRILCQTWSTTAAMNRFCRKFAPLDAALSTFFDRFPVNERKSRGAIRLLRRCTYEY